MLDKRIILLRIELENPVLSQVVFKMGVLLCAQSGKMGAEAR